jgi:hypothetical protein
MKRRITVLFVATVFLPGMLYAGPIYDLSTLSVGGKVTNLGTGAVPLPLSPITAQAFKKNAMGLWVATNLIARNEGEDHGLGVCSEGVAASGNPCHIGGTGGGDVNELSQMTKEEAILLTLAPGWHWTELWVSSLDSGDSPGTSDKDGKEAGKIYWGSSTDVATLLGGPSFNFEFTQFGSAVEGNILGLPGAGVFNAASQSVLFRPNGLLGENNDYLVYGASATNPVPEPATLTLMGLGIAGAAARRRRR